ncbi:hypothetical protein EBZ80_21180 [bacterium]|nr:hypothetical protein [Betaproteobacteria bacterium]NDE17444.1 hypothetical protein [bacterium]
MSLADFADRKYDFLALQNVNTARESKLGLVLYDEDNSGRICTGIQKLSQRWLLEFMTEKGSMPGLPSRGSDFMTLIRQGRLRTQLDVRQSFNAANLRIRVTLQNEEYEGMPADERFDDAELLSVAILPGYLNMRVMITSQAGDERVVILPVATLP